MTYGLSPRIMFKAAKSKRSKEPFVWATGYGCASLTKREAAKAKPKRKKARKRRPK